MSEATVVRSFELIALVKEISKQPSVDSIVWLLMFTLMKSVLIAAHWASNDTKCMALGERGPEEAQLS